MSRRIPSTMWLSFLLICSMAMAGLPGETKPDPPPVGVLFASDGWKVGQRNVQKGDKLPAIATLTVASGESAEVILKCPTHGLLSYSCTRYPCKVPVCSTETDDAKVRRVDKGGQTGDAPQPSFGESLLAILTRHSTEAVTTAVRGELNPNDAVVLLKGEELHLAPALNRVLEGNYCYALRTLDTASDAVPIVFHFAWNKDDEPEGIAKVPGAHPGTFALEKRIPDASSGTCGVDQNAVPAWVAVASESDFPALSAQWKADKPWFDQLASSGASPALVSTARHAAIADLSASIKR